ncbi:MAG TPA: hypothetical protein VF184_03910, partial [Phycisphaeraceae bacterium]
RSKLHHAWVTAGAVALGTSAAWAQQSDWQQSTAAPQPSAQAQPSQQQVEQTLSESFQQHGLSQQQAQQEAQRISQLIQQREQQQFPMSQTELEQQIQQSLQQADLPEDQAQQEAQRLAQQVQQMQQEEQVFGTTPEQEQARQMPPLGQPSEQNLRTISGTVVDVEAYLLHGEQVAKSSQDPRAVLDPFDPVGILTDEGEFYLLMDRQENIRAAQLTRRLRERQEQQEEQTFGTTPPVEESQVEEEWRRIQVGEPDEPHSNAGPESRWERSQAGVSLGKDEPGKEEARQQAQQQSQQRVGQIEIEEEAQYRVEAREGQVQITEEEQVYGTTEPRYGRLDPAYQQLTQEQRQQIEQQPQDAAQAPPLSLSTGDRITITGQVHERGGLRGIVVSGYNVVRSSAAQQQ